MAARDGTARAFRHTGPTGPSVHRRMRQGGDGFGRDGGRAGSVAAEVAGCSVVAEGRRCSGQPGQPNQGVHGLAYSSCQVRPPSVVPTMRCCDRDLPASVNWVAMPAPQPVVADRKLAASGFVIFPTFPSLVTVAPELVARSQGAVPGPHAG